MLYLVSPVYAPNSATTNRMKGYYSALDKMRVEATIIYLYPDNAKNRQTDDYKHLKIVHLWDKGIYINKLLRLLSMLINLWRLYFMVDNGDIVYTYGINRITKLMLSKRQVKIFAERTEYLDLMTRDALNISKRNLIKVARRLDGLIVISRALKQEFVTNGVDESKIVVVNMTVDSNRFVSLQRQSLKDRYIAYCGSVSNVKDGVDILIKAFSIVSKKLNDVKLYIIGNYSSSNEQVSNYELIRSLGIEDRIVFTGAISHEEMPQMLKDADLLVLARPNNEQARCGFPTKLGEYLLTENPVVVTAVGDIPIFLKDNESAFLPEPNDVPAFAEKIIWALENCEAAKEVGRRGRLIALKEFNNVIETSKLIKFIEICTNLTLAKHENCNS